MTFAVCQCQFGAASPKPTRFLSSIPAAATMRFMGPPSFDSSDRYTGPLPRYCGHSHRQRLLGASSTSAAAAYPPDLCKAIATGFHFSARAASVGPEAAPVEHLAAECLRLGTISQAQLLRMSELLPDEDRVRLAEKTIEGQRSFTSGAYVHRTRLASGATPRFSLCHPSS